MMLPTIKRSSGPVIRQRAIVLTTVKMRPGDVGGWGEAGATANLDSPCARFLGRIAGSGGETVFQVQAKKLGLERGKWRRWRIDCR